jgi:hypothetical protein
MNIRCGARPGQSRIEQDRLEIEIRNSAVDRRRKLLADYFCCIFDQPGNGLGLRYIERVTCFDLDFGAACPTGHKSFQVGMDLTILGRDGIPASTAALRQKRSLGSSNPTSALPRKQTQLGNRGMSQKCQEQASS